MARFRDQNFSVSCFFIFLLLQIFRVISQEVEDTSGFDYVAGSLKGPDRWGTLRPDWSTCSNGTMQSPIDLLDQRVQIVTKPERLTRNYKAANATLKNRGHDMMMKWNLGEAGFIEINGTQYFLQQCHWHSPSEHTVNGHKFDLELHLVHQSNITGQLVVVGVTYRINLTPDTYLWLMRNHLGGLISNSTTLPQNRTIVGVFDPSRIRIGSRSYYKYIGSLTVPPCTQNVVWFVSQRVRSVTSQQVNLLRTAVNDGYEYNARPVQRENGRPLQLYVWQQPNE